MENYNLPTHIILPTEVDYVMNVIFGTVSPDKFKFELMGFVSFLPQVTHFDFNINLN